MVALETLVFTCTNPDCGKKVKLKRPQKTGIYPVKCPYCGKKIGLKIQGREELEAAAKATSGSSTGSDSKTTSSPGDNSAAKPIALEGDFKVGVKYEKSCPHCNEKTLIFQPKQPGHKEFACPKCKGPVTAEVKQPTKVVGGTDSECIMLIRGKLILLRKKWFNRDYPLREGRNIVGREDASMPSDISIKGDSTMSRRSVQIDMNHSEKGYTFKLTVLNAVNPVLHNGEALMKGESVSLNFGDIIILGSTKFRFDKIN